MVSGKLPTAPLRTYDDIHRVAGQCARMDDVPWWAAFGYAASMCGSTDAIAIIETAKMWLSGYLTEDEQSSPKTDEVRLINRIINLPL